MSVEMFSSVQFGVGD